MRIVLVLMHHVNGKLAAFVIQSATFALLIVGLTGIVGYPLKFESFYSWFHAGSMSLYTAVGMLLAGINLWLNWYRAEWYQKRDYFLWG